MPTCVSRPDASVGMTLEETGRRPVRGQSRLTKMELQQIPAACLPAWLPVSAEAGAGPPQSKNKQHKKPAGWDLCTYNSPGVSSGAWQ